MSIIAYTGLPGSGKSYSVVKHQIIPALKLGRTVVTNIPLNEVAIRETIKTGKIIDLPMDKIQQEPHLIDEYAVPGCVLVLDELWRLFPAGEKVNRVPEPFKSLLAEHRHRVDESGSSMQIVFVTQSVSQIGAFARQLIEQTVITTKLTDVGLSGRFRIDVFRQAQPVERFNVQNAIRSIQAQKYEKHVFAYYQSHTMRESSEVGDVNEVSIDNRGSILKRPFFIIGPIFILLVAFFGVPHIIGIASGKVSLTGKPAADDSSMPATPGSTPVRNTQPHRTSPAKLIPPPLPDYELLGWVEFEDGRGHALIKDGKHSVSINLRDCFPEWQSYTCEYRGHLVAEVGTLSRIAPATKPNAVVYVSQ